MTAALGSYEEYAEKAIENFARLDAARRYALVEAVESLKPQTVLDVGCGAGQEMLPFVERTNASCVGIDIAAELGKIGKSFVQKSGVSENRMAFVRSPGEDLPFADESFDVVLCRIALPYMNNRRALAEVARVMRPGGVFLLKTHAPPFYFGMIRRRLKTLSAKQIAYPLICLASGTFHLLTGRQLQKGFWRGKEVFQTEGFIRRECARNGLEVTGFLADTNPETPSFVIKKKR